MACIKEIKGDAIVLDVPESGDFIDVSKFADELMEFLEYLTSSDIIKLKSNKKELTEKVKMRFPKLIQNDFGIYDKIIACEDISLLFQMLEGILAIQTGKASREDIEKQIGEQLNKRYVHTK